MVYKLSTLFTLSCLAGFALLALPAVAAPGPSPDVTGPIGTVNEVLDLVPEVLSKEPPVKLRAPHATFVGCSIQRQRQIVSVVEATKGLIVSAHQFTVTPGNFVSRRFVTWFGAYKESRAIAVQQNWERMVAANFDTWIYTCGNCTRTDSGADFDANKYGELSFCPSFWTGNETVRTDVILSLLVQFNSIAGVGSNATTLQAAKDLAAKTPDRAIDNAYSYVFYANNNPPL